MQSVYIAACRLLHGYPNIEKYNSLHSCWVKSLSSLAELLIKLDKASDKSVGKKQIPNVQSI